jgi:hypothetical protein
VAAYSEAGVLASDACAGDLSSRVVISGQVGTAVGTYEVSYSVADEAGHSSSAVRTVSVSDTLAPGITLNGASTVALECGLGSYSEAGATASDVCTGDLSNKVSISGTVNVAARGTYSRTYSVADASGNTASAARTVNVADTRAPGISLVGSASMSVNRGSTFVDPGATASDACSGNLTAAIVKTGTVNTAVAGTYTLNYSVQDGAGLSASVARTVTVMGDSCNTTVAVRPTQQIWPPNHHYQSFRLSDCASVTNSCGTGSSGADINAMGTILSIYSDEVEDAQGNGDGHTVGDMVDPARRNPDKRRGTTLCARSSHDRANRQ